MIKVGLLGAGRIATVHATAITGHPDTELTAVADIFEDAAKALTTRFGGEVRSADAIIDDPEIDVVLVATSTDTHSTFIEHATAAGKTVLCEKPVDLSLERARECLAKASGTGKPVMIGFNRRFDINFAAVKTALAAGEIGKAEMLAITSFDPAPPPIAYIKVSGGLFRDMMIHDFDMANFIMGELPVTVSAVGTSVVNPDIAAAGDVDTAVVTMTYADGSIGVIRNSRRAGYGYDQRLELLGSGGMLQVENMLENQVKKSTADGVLTAKPTYFFLERYMPAFAAEWAAFVLAMKEGTAMPVSLEDGINALVLAEAATRSAKTGAPVKIADLI
ncbi:MAG: inositol 2-dehydrogenase [Qingshengfaniella sp.]